jgi:radical SAM superfamily enzyme YgiQ (UPF0313 family)
VKILLIDPPFYRFINYYNRYFPLGLAYLAASLRDKGHDVLIYDSDCNVNPSKMDFTSLENSYPFYLESLRNDGHLVWSQLGDAISDFKPDVVGISVWTTFAASSFKVAALCKQYDRAIPVVAGGPHATIKCDEVMKVCPDIDFLVKGEGEQTFLELTERLKDSHELCFENLRDLSGIVFRQSGQTIHTLDRELIQDLDTVPFPARDLLLNKGAYDSEDMGLLMTSRGCPYNCSYCATSIWRRKIRYRSIDNIIGEIKFVIDTYGTRQFTFKDDSFTVNRKRVVEFCDRLVKEGLDINWDCNTRVDLVDEQLLEKMQSAGCNSIKVGIETGSPRILKLINKRTTLSQAREAAGLFRKAGIHWTGYFMMGLPSETREEIYQTLEFMKELKPDFASLSVYESFPGTDLFEIGIDRGLVQRERTLEDFYNISPKYYYLKDINRRVDTMSNEELEELESEMKRAFHRYNKGFVRLAKRAKSRNKLYLHDPRMLWGDIKKLCYWLR